MGSAGQQLRHRGVTALQARGGGEYDVSDADIEAFYKETISGNGGDPPKGMVVSELIVKFFYGDFTPQGFVRYSGLWKGPPPGAIGKRDIKIGVERLKKFFETPNPAFISKGVSVMVLTKPKKLKTMGKDTS